VKLAGRKSILLIGQILMAVFLVLIGVSKLCSWYICLFVSLNLFIAVF